jgi:hypothetical protein
MKATMRIGARQLGQSKGKHSYMRTRSSAQLRAAAWWNALAGYEASFVQGQEYAVDGGMTF